MASNEHLVMQFENNTEIDAYKDFFENTLERTNQHMDTLAYFGDIRGTKIVDFGCGYGAFLRLCSSRGTVFCLGIDVSQSMIISASNSANDENMKFVVKDCFNPIEQYNGQFDFATGHFVVPFCKNDCQLTHFAQNMFRMLKPGGKMLIAQVDAADTLEHQEILAAVRGVKVPLKSQRDGKDYVNAEVLFYRPNVSKDEPDKPFKNEVLFSMNTHNWSPEKLVDTLSEVGFVNIKIMRTPLPVPAESSYWKEKTKDVKNIAYSIRAEKPIL